MSIVGNGSSVLVFDANGSPIACQRNVDVTFNDDLIDVTCKQSNGYSEFLAGKRSFSMTCEALTDWGQNLFLWSEDFSNAAWIKSNINVTNNASTAPNNTLTADLITAPLAASNAIYQIINTEGILTLSVYAKADTSNFIYLDIFDFVPAQDYTAVFDLSNGTYVGNAGTGTVDNYTIQNEGNGWYRLSITKDLGSGLQNHNFIYGVANGNNVTPLANTSVLTWGAQVNTGTTAQSYYQTTSTVNPNIDTLVSANLNRTKVELNIANPAFDDIYFNGEAYVESIELNAGTESEASYTVTFSGTADLVSLVS